MMFAFAALFAALASNARLLRRGYTGGTAATGETGSEDGADAAASEDNRAMCTCNCFL